MDRITSVEGNSVFERIVDVQNLATKHFNKSPDIHYIISNKFFKLTFSDGSQFKAGLHSVGPPLIDYYFNHINKMGLNIPKLHSYKDNVAYFYWVDGINFFELQRCCHAFISEYDAYRIGKLFSDAYKQNIFLRDGHIHNYIITFSGHTVHYVDSESVTKIDDNSRVTLGTKVLETVRKRFTAPYRAYPNIIAAWHEGLDEKNLDKGI